MGFLTSNENELIFQNAHSEVKPGGGLGKFELISPPSLLFFFFLIKYEDAETAQSIFLHF